jgi:uncharacterized protein (TIGR02246 family)
LLSLRASFDLALSTWHSFEELKTEEIMRPIRRLLTMFVAAAVMAAGGFAVAQDDPIAAAKANIAEQTRKFVSAFNAGDAKAMSAFWTEEGDFAGENGDRFRFRDQLAAKIAADGDKENKDRPSLAMFIENVRFVTPAVATVDGTSVFRPHGNASAMHGQYTATWVLRGNRWLLDSVRENLVSAGLHHSHLMELDWMVGDWVEQGKDPRLESSVRWSADGNFLERTFRSRLPGRGDQGGMARIGWDPKRKQFRSWTFGNDGSFSHGLWEPIANGWSVEVGGVSSDGRSTGSQTRITRIDDNTVEWDSTEATVEGESLPDLKVRLIRRVAK